MHIKQHIKVLTSIFCILLVTSCANPAKFKKELNDIAAEDRIKNQQIYLAMGERNFDINQRKLMKAFVTTFSNKNVAVINLDKEIGFLLAEGEGFLSPSKYKETGMKNIDRLNNRTKKWGYNWTYTPGNSTFKFTVNFFHKTNGSTTAKVGVSNKVAGNYSIKNHEIPPIMLTAIYEELWVDLEKSIFILRETQDYTIKP